MTPTRLAEIEAHFNGRIPKTLPVRLALEACKIARSLESDLAKANTKIGEQEACYDQHERLESDNARLTRELAEANTRLENRRYEVSGLLQRNAELETERDAARAEKATLLKAAEAVETMFNRANERANKARAEAEALRALLQEAREYIPGKGGTNYSIRMKIREALTAGAARTRQDFCTSERHEGAECPDCAPKPAAEPPAKCTTANCENPATAVCPNGCCSECCIPRTHPAPPKPEPRAECPHACPSCLQAAKYGGGVSCPWHQVCPASQWGK